MTATQHEIEIYKERIRRFSIEVSGGAVEALEESTETGTAVRVIRDGRQGFSYSTSPLSSEKELIDQARQAASVSAPDADLCLPNPSKLPAYSFEGSVFTGVSADEKIEMARELERSALAGDKRIKAVRKPIYQEYIKEVHIKNSNGVDESFTRGVCSLRVTALAGNGSDSEWATEEEYSLNPRKVSAGEIGKRAAEKAVSYLGGRKAASERLPCLIERRVTAQLLGAVSGAFFADSVYKKRSPLIDKAGIKFYSPLITIVDDAVLPGGFLSAPCDAEGVPTSRISLVKEGVIRSYLSDLYYSKKVADSSAGACVRSGVTQMPKIGIHNLHILPGRDDPAELEREMVKGFIVTDIMGLHTANQVTGDFSIGAVGYFLESGRRAFPVKGVTIAGNLHEVFKRVAGVGSDLKFWYSTGAPSILIEEISLSG